MKKSLNFFILYLFIGGCIEPYEFVVYNNKPTLVVEAFISDKSFNETLLYPSDGRYFTVILTRTGDVINTRPDPVQNAIVELVSDNGGLWQYTEDGDGVFRLLDNEFKALPGISYKLRIVLDDESIYESEWESLPDVVAPVMGDIGFVETEEQVYIMEASEWVLRSIKGVMVNVGVEENNSGSTLLYRWTYSPTWIYKAPLSSVVDPGNICWATDKNYLNTYQLQADRSGGYVKDLFFFRTIRNERIFEKMSVLVTQQTMSDQFYNFWSEMKESNDGGRLNDIPPYNLQTNYHSTTGDNRVSGFFGVVNEQAKRWYFSRHDLSYYVVNTLKADCLVDYGGPPAAECTDCREYSFGVATTTRPVWWE